MADNVTANAGSGGATFAAPELSFSGDTVKLPIGANGLLTGAEGSWSFTLLVGGSGAVGAGVQRVTLASDDPAVTVLGATGDAAATQGSTGSISAKLRTVTSQLNTIDGKITAVNTGAVVVSSSALPSGASTAAKQPALGTAGTASTDVLSIQGIASMTPLQVADNGSSLTVDNGGTFAVQVSSAIPAGTNNIGDVDVLTVPSDPFGANADAASATGSISAKLRFIASTGIPITGTVTVGSHEVTNAGTFAVQVSSALPAGTNAIGKLASNTGVTIGAVEIASAQTLATVTTVSTVTTCSTLTGSGIAHDAADSGNPHKIGAKAETSPKGVTLVSDGDRSDLYCDADGLLMVKLNTAWGDLISERVSNTDGNSTAFTTFDNAAGTRNYITHITVHNSHSSTNGYVDIRDGTAGSVIWTIPLPATGGATIHFDPPLRQPTAATALAYDVSAAISTVYISVNGFKSKV